MATTCSQGGALRLTLDAQARNLLDPFSRLAIHERYTPSAVAFFKASFEQVLAEALHPPPDSPMAAVLRQHFGAV